ncbi:ATP-binding protein [Rhodococcus aerolatus]
MRRRVLLSVLLVVALTALLLGAPLVLATWRLVEDITRADAVSSLERVVSEVELQELPDGRLPGALDTGRLALAIPAGSELVVTLATEGGGQRVLVVGPQVVSSLEESLPLGQGGSVRLVVSDEAMRTRQLQATAIVGLVMALSVLGGAAVAVATARRLAVPLQEVADRAARLGAGDFRPEPRRYGVAELDRVSEVLDSSAVELAALVQREREMVGDVSHQLRSRLTAVRLRLDELSDHPDPDVVEEATAALDQVDRLTSVVGDVLAASREERGAGRAPVDVAAELAPVVADWRPTLAAVGRELVLEAEPGRRARVAPARLREAVGVLVENAAQHGGGPVTVRVRGVAARGGRAEHEDRVVVEVQDEGPGIPDELVPHVFERGFSGGSSTGVGLALARALVETDGGRLELRRARPPLFTLYLTGADAGVPRTVGVREPR